MPGLLASVLVLALTATAHAQNASVVTDVPTTIVTCRSLRTGREVCDRTAPTPADWRIIADRQLRNRVPSTGGLVPEEGVSRIRVEFVRHDVAYVEVIVTLSYGLLDPQKVFSSGTENPSIATALASALISSLPRTRESDSPTSGFIVAYFHATQNILNDPSLPALKARVTHPARLRRPRASRQP